MLSLKYRKALFCLLHPNLWGALANRVAPSIEHATALRHRPFKTIVDVGANRGQFALFARILNPDASIYAFEPLDEPKAVFDKLFATDPLVRVQQIAIGSSDHDATIFVTVKDDSSSLLAVEPVQRQIFGTVASSAQTVPVRRLASCLSAADIKQPSLLKIDVQGTELDVLAGSEELLPLFTAVYVECSFVPLYKAQALADEVIKWMQQHDFVVGGVFNQHEHPGIGPVQADFLFVRPGAKPFTAAPAR